MNLHNYKNYTEYRAAQVKANHAKIKCSWVRPETVDFICDRILKVCPVPKFGLCHGTRRGVEQKLFIERLNCEVIGTEISDTAEKFPNTIEWDFHIAKHEWVKACDFIYSNSLDHSYNPAGALEKWISCLNGTGILAIEWTEKINQRVKRSTPVDPFAGTTDEVIALIEKAGGEVTEVKRIKYKKASRRSSSSRATVAIIFARAIQ
jgi:hypothetical protein